MFGALNQLLQRELDACGIEYTYIDCRNPEDDRVILDTLSALRSQEYEAAVGFNVQGMHRLAMPDGENAFDHYVVPFLTGSWTRLWITMIVCRRAVKTTM